MAIGSIESSIRLTIVSKLRGHSAGGPSTVEPQSNAAIFARIVAVVMSKLEAEGVTDRSSAKVKVLSMKCGSAKWRRKLGVLDCTHLV
jgi:hypothetical protein